MVDSPVDLSTDLSADLSIDQLLKELHQLDIKLWVEEGRLHSDAPKGSITPALRTTIQAHKTELITFLSYATQAQRAAAFNIQPIPRAALDHIPLSLMQEGLWLFQQIEAETTAYNEVSAVQIDGVLAIEPFQNALAEIVRRHESLRTTFVITSTEETSTEEPSQVIHPPTFTLPILDLSHVPPAQQRAEIQALAQQEAATRFDLARGPLFRGTLLRFQTHTDLGQEPSGATYVLLLTMHHLVGDAWSMGLLIQELSTLYAAFVAGKPSPLPDLPIQYADYAIWQRTDDRGAAWAADLDWWRAQLAGAPSLLQLPTAPGQEAARPTQQAFRGQRIRFTLPGTTVVPLRALAQQSETTLYMVLLAAFTILLARYSRQTDIVIGSPIANRQQQALEALIGFFANIVVLRTQISADQSFLDLLAQVKQTTQEAYAHQDIPFASLVSALQPQRHLSYSPLFQVLFTFQNIPTIRDLASTELRMQRIDLDLGSSRYDLSLELYEQGNALAGSFEYNSDLFDEATITRLTDHFTLLLQNIVAHPTLPVMALPMLTAAEYHRLVYEWNETTVDFGAFQPVHTLVEQQVAKRPNAVAVIFDKQAGRQAGEPGGAATHPLILSYAELNRRANQLAHYLIGLGVGNPLLPHCHVAVAMDRSPEMVVALLAVLKAGGTYIPLDPTYPQERLEFMLEDAQVALLLTQTHLRDRLPSTAAQVIAVDGEWAHIALQPDSNPLQPVQPTDLAYVIYTSGSTGRPKGVQIPHKALTNFLQSMKERPGLNVADTLLAVTTLAFDIAALEIYLPLVVGAQLVLVDQETTVDGSALAATLVAHQVTAMQATPATWRLLIESGWRGTPQLKILCGGEAMPLALKQQLQIRCRELWNVYGPTETTIWSTVHQIVPTDKQILIGRPIANTQTYILDEGLNPVPVGVVGTLYIGGDGVAAGYLNRDALMRERFIDHPFVPSPATYHMGEIAPNASRGTSLPSRPNETQASSPGRGKLYNTGDLARYHPDGTIECLGRSDHQVKIRGFRIEPGEIETLLCQHPAVKEAVVVARSEQNGERRLVAYLIVDQVLSSELLDHLHAKLPDYMVPSHFVVLAALPLTPNGKVDRNALPAPSEQNSVTTTLHPPRTPTEATLAAIWQEVLGVEKLGIDDNFFGLGGHSLLAMQAVARIRRILKVELPLRALFQTPTVRALASAIRSLQTTQQRALLPPLEPVSRAQRLPLSYAQARMWFLAQLEGSNRAYHVPLTVEISGPLAIDALQQSWALVVARHEALRTRYQVVDGIAYQEILAEVKVELPYEMLATSPADDATARVQRWLQERVHTPFDLENELPWHLSLLQVADDHHVLLLVLHHITTDSWSTDLLWREWRQLYAALVQGAALTLPALPVQYADYAMWQRQWLAGRELDEQLDFWRQQLAGAPALLALSTDYPRPAVQRHHGGAMPFTVDSALTAAIQVLCVRQGVTPFMLLMAAFQLLLHRYSGQDDIVVGTPIANRTQLETEGVVGTFANTLALRSRIAADRTFADLLIQVRTTLQGVYDHQALPFEMLIDALQPERSLSHAPLFQVMFALENVPQRDLILLDLSLRVLNLPTTTTKFDLTLIMWEGSQGLAGFWEYDSDLFEPATIQRMMGHFQTLLRGIVANPHASLAQLPILTSAEEEQILVEWNQPATSRSPHHQDTQVHSLHQLFEAQAAHTPERIALCYVADTPTIGLPAGRRNGIAATNGNRHAPLPDTVSLTYRELNEEANQLAHHLRSLGVGKQRGSDTEQPFLVGLCIERSIKMVVGLLGILKAGGAYVPLDPTYPQERLAFMVADADLALILTEERWRQQLPPSNARVVCLDNDQAAIAQQSCANLQLHVQADDLAYVLYTSGSTGRPKGVMVAHGGLGNLVTAQRQAFGVQDNSHVLQFASLNFDASISEIGMALCSGAQLCLVAPAIIQSGEMLMQVMAAHSITHITLPPSYLRMVTEQIVQDNLEQRDVVRLPDLTTLIVAGEACPPGLVAEWAPGRRFFNAYGPTEATVCATIGECHATDQLITIGRPMDHVQIYILDPAQQPVPIGVPGELYIGGVGVARGYLNQPALTAEKFISNPFSKRTNQSLGYPSASATVYKSGDRARWLLNDDGIPHIEFLGRIDHQIKLRGFRIELGEIEAVLRQHPTVENAVVVTRPVPTGIADNQPVSDQTVSDQTVSDQTVSDQTASNQSVQKQREGTGEACLVAYIVAKPGAGNARPDPATLRAYLQQLLPDYMTPTAFVMLERLPLNPNGKIDRGALPAPGMADLPVQAIFVPATTATAVVLASIWVEVLGFEPISTHANFFDLGGHSLLATQVVTRIRDAFQLELSLQEFFQQPTIAALAATIDDLRLMQELRNPSVTLDAHRKELTL